MGRGLGFRVRAVGPDSSSSEVGSSEGRTKRGSSSASLVRCRTGTTSLGGGPQPAMCWEKAMCWRRLHESCRIQGGREGGEGEEGRRREDQAGKM